MAFLIELPSDLERELTVQAERRGLTTSELITSLLMSSPLISVRPSAMTIGRSSPGAIDPLDREKIISSLQESKGSGMRSSAHPDVTSPVGRKNRVSALGKFAHLDFSTESFIAEKRLETDREDRP